MVNNQFVFFKILVRDGWINKETGKKSEPRIQFQEVKLLADVLPSFAKKLIIQFKINELHHDLINKMRDVFKANEGQHSLTFEIMETEIAKTSNNIIAPKTPLELVDEEDSLETNELEIEEQPEQVKVVNFLNMPSRRVKVAISKNLLEELERMQINFKLN